VRNDQKVTHQGSARKRLHDLLQIQLTRPEKTQRPGLPDASLQCHHCGEVCEPFLRHDFLQSHQFKRSSRQSGLFNLANKAEIS
jgi:hypothetical protein